MSRAQSHYAGEAGILQRHNDLPSDGRLKTSICTSLVAFASFGRPGPTLAIQSIGTVPVRTDHRMAVDDDIMAASVHAALLGAQSGRSVA